MATLDLSHILEESDIHDKYLERYEANFLMRDLWRVGRGRLQWKKEWKGALKTTGAGGGGSFTVVGAGRSDPTDSAFHYLDVEVPPATFLEHEGCSLRFYRTKLSGYERTANAERKAALYDYLAQPRHNAIFGEDRMRCRMVKNQTASWELAKVAISLHGLAQKIL